MAQERGSVIDAHEELTEQQKHLSPAVTNYNDPEWEAYLDRMFEEEEQAEMQRFVAASTCKL